MEQMHRLPTNLSRAPCREQQSTQQESKNMNVVHDCRRVMVCSASWHGPLSSPVLALGATKVVALLWTLLLRS